MTAKPSVSAVVIGRHLDITRQRVQQLVDERVIARLPDGSFDLDTCRIAYVRWLRSEDRRAVKSAVNSRMADARAREVELRVEAKEGAMMATADALVAIDAIVGPLIAELSAIPARVTDDVSIRRRIEDETDVVLNAMANRFASIGAELKAGRDVLAEPTSRHERRRLRRAGR